MIREMSWGQYWGKARRASSSNTTAPAPSQHRPVPPPAGQGGVLRRWWAQRRWKVSQPCTWWYSVFSIRSWGSYPVSSATLRRVTPRDERGLRDYPLPEEPLRAGCPPSILRAPSVTSSSKWVDEELWAAQLGRPPARGDSGPDHPPGVQEDELHVQAGAEHEHVTVQFDLRDGAGRQRVAHGHQAHVLVAAVERGHVQAVLADLQVAAAVNDLRQTGKAGGSATGRKHPQEGVKGTETFAGSPRPQTPEPGVMGLPRVSREWRFCPTGAHLGTDENEPGQPLCIRIAKWGPGICILIMFAAIKQEKACIPANLWFLTSGGGRGRIRPYE